MVATFALAIALTFVVAHVLIIVSANVPTSV